MLTKIQAKILGTHKSETYGRYTPYHKMSALQLEQMYEIYKEYYHNTNFSLFVDDFKKKDGAILIFESAQDNVVGFSTVVLNHLKYEGKSYRFIFSGDTVIQKRYWGSRALQNEMFKLIMKTRLRYPLDEVFWMLISKGYKTYLLLANNYYVYYPHAKGKHEHLAPVVQQYCDRFYSQYYDKHTGLLDFGDDYQPLKGEIAPITHEMRNGNLKIDFFEKMNPTWKDGTELPCVGHIRWRDVVRYPARFVTKATSKGRHEANSETPKDLDHSEQQA